LKCISYVLFVTFQISCKTKQELITKYNTELGKLKFYYQSFDNVDENYRQLVATINNYRYDFKEYQIIKQTGEEEGQYFELFYDEFLIRNKEQIHEFSPVDSMVLTKADLLLDSLRWNDFARFKGAKGFVEKEFAYLE